jgi:hypothetical protein
MEEYNFMISNFPENLDLSDIPIEIFYENNEVKIVGNFTNNQEFKYVIERIDYSDRTLLRNQIYYEKTFDYNIKPSSVQDLELKTFISKIEEIAVKNGSVEIEIIGSASKVPTKAYSSNIQLARARVEDAKKIIFSNIDLRKIKRNQIKIVKELPIVDGPEYKNDAQNKSKYGKYQYIRILAK